jgi:predicted DNA-binding transcriptional regulator
MERWTFLTNHGHVFLCIAADPNIRLKEVAQKVGITERSAQRIVTDLIAGGYLSQEKIGRRNHYVVHPDLPLRHPLERESQVGTLLGILRRKGRKTRSASSSRANSPTKVGFKTKS